MYLSCSYIIYGTLVLCTSNKDKCPFNKNVPFVSIDDRIGCLIQHSSLHVPGQWLHIPFISNVIQKNRTEILMTSWSGWISECRHLQCSRARRLISRSAYSGEGFRICWLRWRAECLVHFGRMRYWKAIGAANAGLVGRKILSVKEAEWIQWQRYIPPHPK